MPPQSRRTLVDVPIRLRPAADIREEALAVLEAERERLARLVPTGELSLTGASSVPGALTRGDVDLHLRVRAQDFRAAVAVLADVYAVVHPEIWTSTLATFAVDAPIPAGVAVTPIGSEHDLRFTRAWSLLASRPELLRAYNEMKLAHAGRPVADYEAAKSAFFSRLVGDAE